MNRFSSSSQAWCSGWVRASALAGGNATASSPVQRSRNETISPLDEAVFCSASRWFRNLGRGQ